MNWLYSLWKQVFQVDCLRSFCRTWFRIDDMIVSLWSLFLKTLNDELIKTHCHLLIKNHNFKQLELHDFKANRIRISQIKTTSFILKVLTWFCNVLNNYWQIASIQKHFWHHGMAVVNTKSLYQKLSWHHCGTQLFLYLLDTLFDINYS